MTKRSPHPPLSLAPSALLILALLALLATAGFGQDDKRGLAVELKKKMQEQPPPAGVTELPGKQKRWALIIGVDEYKDGQIGRLGGAANDAHALADALVRYAGFPPDQVILLSTDQPEERQPSRVNILRRLSNLAGVIPKDGLLLFSFAGHGMERNGQAYLLPSDAQFSNDIAFLEDTAVSVSRMKDRIKATGVGQVIVLLDACRNDPGGRADAPNPLSSAYTKFNFDVRNREVQAFATIYATAVGQRAYEYTEKKQGYFTWALVEGLKGGAANENGEITLSQLVSYVQGVVPKRLGIDLGAGRQQRPFAVVEGYKAEQLIVAVARGVTAAAPAGAHAPAGDAPSMEVSFWETIKTSTDPADFQAYLDRFPNGTFSTLARRRAVTAAAPGSAPAPAAPAASSSSAARLLAQAELDYGDRSYDAVIKSSREILSAQPDHPRANLLLGLSFLKLKRYTNSAAYLTKALALGERIDIPIKHHHYVLLSGDALCEGYLSFSKNLFEFHSTTQAGHDFGVPFSKINEFVAEQLNGGRLRVKVGIQKENKEDRKTYNFYLTDAYISKKAGTSVDSVFCDVCQQDLMALFQLIQQLLQVPIELPAPAPSQTGAPASEAKPGATAGASESSPDAAERDRILQELIGVERKGFDAAIKGDRATIASMLTDEFKQTQDGKTYNKAQLLAAVKPQPLLRSYNYESVSLSLSGETATLTGVVAYHAQSANAMVTIRQSFTDQLVKRDGRWLVLSSQIVTLK
jgi:tetratricopeptide (TPR) repeat protein